VHVDYEPEPMPDRPPDTPLVPLVDYDGRPIETAPASPVSRSTQQPPASGRQRSLRGRLAWVYGALALVATGGIAALVVGLVSDSPTGATVGNLNLEGSPYARTQEIATEVTARYRAQDGAQLAAGLAGPPIIVANQPEGSTQILVRTVAITPDLPSGGASTDRDVVLVDGNTSVQYVLCGYGVNCSIAKGEPSVERHTLLRREALELALYTFKHVPNINSVSVFLPPRPDGATAPTMVFLQRDDVKFELSQPLEKSLSTATPKIGEIAPDELERVNRITGKRLYQYDYTQAQDGSAVMLLDPVVT
jgi:hypothetical protein